MKNSCLDLKILNQLSELSPNGDKFVRSLLAKFLINAPKLIVKIQDDFLKSEYEEVRKSAHYFKSSCGNLGAMGLSKLCSQIQHLSDAEMSGVATTLLSKIEKEYKKVEKEMRSLAE